jgi:nitrite reductase/ring-hydroxylating ferredoxin subunit
MRLVIDILKLKSKVSEGTLNKSVVTYLRHLSKFDMTTGRVNSGTRNSLPSYNVKVDGYDLLIES